MTSYAPNPTTGAANAAASLTSGLLARKGQAMPAVDAVAHEGVDIEMGYAEAASPRNTSESSVETLYPQPNGSPTASRVKAPAVRRAAMARRRARIDAPPQTGRPSEHAPNIIDVPATPVAAVAISPFVGGDRPANDSAGKPAEIEQRSTGDGNETPEPQLRATVRLRMPARDLIRLRFAARDLQESCQSIILDALAAYLDANEIAPVDEATAVEEAQRLKKRRTQTTSSE